GLALGGVWRSDPASAAGELPRQRQPDRSARLLRRRQALRRDAVLRLPPPAQCADSGGADLQYLWAAHAPQRWARRLQLHRPGAEERADHIVWRRQPDPLLLLCRRSDRGLAADDGRAGLADR